MAMKDIVTAKWQKVMTDEKYQKICATLCSRLCALPVCVIAWFASYRLAAAPASTILNPSNKVKSDDSKSQQQQVLNGIMPPLNLTQFLDFEGPLNTCQL